jgi:hypothetical protein
MTEAEWQSCADPRQMQQALRGRASERKLRLFAVACCHRLGPVLQDPRITAALDVAERHADGAATQADLEAALRGAALAQRAQRSVEGCGASPAETATRSGFSSASSMASLFSLSKIPLLEDAGAVGVAEPVGQDRQGVRGRLVCRLGSRAGSARVGY